MQNKTDISPAIIEKAQKGDLNSLKILLKKAEKNIYSYLVYLTEDSRERDDMAQEILLKVSKNIGKLKNPEVFKSWLNKIILRQYYDFIRKNRNCCNITNSDITDVKEADTITDNGQQPIEKCICNELSNVIKESVCKLQEPYKLAILMREFQGLTYEEIAKLTNTSVGTVKSRISRARSRLKEFIKPYME